jgi:hypothetical protein
MAKIKMAQVAGLPIRTLRRMVGIPAHRPSGFNACVGARLKDQKYSKPPIGMGGQNDKRIQSAFINAVQACKGGGRSSRAKATASAANYDY